MSALVHRPDAFTFYRNGQRDLQLHQPRSGLWAAGIEFDMDRFHCRPLTGIYSSALNRVRR